MLIQNDDFGLTRSRMRRRADRRRAQERDLIVGSVLVLLPLLFWCLVWALEH